MLPVEWIRENPLLCAGIVGILVFLLAAVVTVAVMKKKRRRIEQEIQAEYEGTGAGAV